MSKFYTVQGKQLVRNKSPPPTHRPTYELHSGFNQVLLTGSSHAEIFAYWTANFLCTCAASDWTICFILTAPGNCPHFV